jgi:hypothetical protein
MGTKSRETVYGASVRAAAEAAEVRKQADRLTCEAWNKRVLAFIGPAQPSPTLGDALNAGLPRCPLPRLQQSDRERLARLSKLLAYLSNTCGSNLSEGGAFAPA